MVMSEIRIRTIRLAQNLLEHGCTQNDRVAIVARNSHNITPLAAALLCIGTPFNAVDINLIKGLLRHFVGFLFNIFSLRAF